MDINDLIAMATEGMSEAEAAPVKAALMRDVVKTKAAGIKAQKEYEAIEQRANSLQVELEGGPQKPGAKAYQEWYTKNQKAIENQSAAITAYDKKYGDGSFFKAAEKGFGTEANPNPNPNPNPAQLSTDDVKRLVEESIQGKYSPRWSDLLTTTGTLVQKHMFAGRKTPIDFSKLGELATTKYGGNLEMAYDEWDKPEREKSAAEEETKRVNKRVEEELQKRGANQFPSGADMSSGTLATKPKAETDKFDRTALNRELAQAWNNPTSGGTQ